MPFSNMTQITHPTSPATKTSTRNVFLGAQTPNPGHLDQYGGCSPRTLGCFGMKWPFRVRLATLYSTDPRLILAQIESKSDSHISLVRDQIYSNPWAGRHLYAHYLSPSARASAILEWNLTISPGLGNSFVPHISTVKSRF